MRSNCGGSLIDPNQFSKPKKYCWIAQVINHYSQKLNNNRRLIIKNKVYVCYGAKGRAGFTPVVTTLGTFQSCPSNTETLLAGCQDCWLLMPQTWLLLLFPHPRKLPQPRLQKPSQVSLHQWLIDREYEEPATVTQFGGLQETAQSAMCYHLKILLSGHHMQTFPSASSCVPVLRGVSSDNNRPTGSEIHISISGSVSQEITLKTLWARYGP